MTKSNGFLGKDGGWGGIRTHGELAPTAVFKTAALNHSATHPLDQRHIIHVRRGVSRGKQVLYRTMLLSTVIALTAGTAMAQPAPLPAPDPRGVVSMIAENDSFGITKADRWYTSGVRLGYSSPEAMLSGPLEALDNALARLFGPAQSRWGVGIGQNIYTPRDIRAFVPNPTDRPYAGYAYVEASLDRRTANTLDRFTIQAGIIGPGSLARKTQDITHELIGSGIPRGWRYQMRDEPTFNLGWQRTWRQELLRLPAGLAVDSLPAVELAAGTVAVYAQAGLRLRLGQGLDRDFGTPRIRPGGADNPAPVGQGFGWYVFAGASGRAVARDVFLDGSTWRSSSPSVQKRPLVGDLEAGAAIFWHDIRLSATQVWRSEEFTNQRKSFNYGIISLSFAL